MRASLALCMEAPTRQSRATKSHQIFELKPSQKIRPWLRTKPSVDFRRSVDRFAIAIHYIRETNPENEPQSTESDFPQRFRTLAGIWRRETRAISALKRKILHPAYQQIIGMGPGVVPLILNELSERPDDWMWALNSITHEDPAPEKASFDEAVDAWLSWGKKRQLVS